LAGIFSIAPLDLSTQTVLTLLGAILMLQCLRLLW